MKTADNMNNRRMNFILWFIVVAVSYHLLDLQFYFSSKGALLSSAIAAAFGASALTVAQKHPRWQPALSLISPFVFVACFYFAHPVAKSLLLGLTWIMLMTGLWTTMHANSGVESGGRGELSFILKSASDTYFVKRYHSLFRAWSTAGLCAVIFSPLIASPWLAFVFPAAIAVILSSVVNSTDAKEPQ